MSNTFTSRPGVVRQAGRGRGSSSQSTPAGAGGRGAGISRGVGTRPSRATVRTQTTSTRTRSTMAGQPEASGPYLDMNRGPNPGMSSGEPAQQQDRVHHAGAFTMIAPSEDKRRKVKEMAEKEQAQYENYKNQKKLGHVSYVGTVGGGLTESASRQQAAQSQPTRAQRLMQQQERRDSVRQRENQQLAAKKAQARQRSIDNSNREMDREARLREDMRRKNNAFLDRLEGKSH